MIDATGGSAAVLVAAVVAGPIEPAVVDFGGFVEAKVDCFQRSAEYLFAAEICLLDCESVCW